MTPSAMEARPEVSLARKPAPGVLPTQMPTSIGQNRRTKARNLLPVLPPDARAARKQDQASRLGNGLGALDHAVREPHDVVLPALRIVDDEHEA
jgi:hypothetical protein